MTLPLSILDLVPLSYEADAGAAMRNSLELAERADRLGYTRYWFAEHHNMPTIASTTPEIMIALAGARTNRIRFGSGGVMLPNHAPLKVAETYKMLEALYPGRIDLGIGRAPGTDPATAIALRGSRQALGAEQFPASLLELLEYGSGGVKSALGGKLVRAVPDGVDLPPIWLLGSSDYGARLAAQMGAGFAFAAHFSDMPAELPMLGYRQLFETGGMISSPHAILTLSVVCADTNEDAEHLIGSLLVSFARLRTGQESLLLSPEEAAKYDFSPAEKAVADEVRERQIAGTPERVKAAILERAAQTSADEVMISSFIPGHRQRLHSYELIAEAFALPVAA